MTIAATGPQVVGTVGPSAPSVPVAPARTARVLVASPAPLVRYALRHLLDGTGDVRVVAEAATPRESLQRLSITRPDVAVLDLTKDTEVPIEPDTVLEMLRHHKDTRFLILAGARGGATLPQLIAHGVNGVVSRDCDLSVIVTAVVTVGSGRGFFHLERHVEDAPSRPRKAGSDSGALTARERQVVRLLALGLTNRGIGADLHISETTAKFHVSGVMRKFGVRTRAEVVHQATLLGLV